MLRHLRPALAMIGLLTALTGLAYPYAVTAVAQLVLPAQANGSLVTRKGKVVGSELIGQAFSDPRFLWGRPSATTPACNAAASSGSNAGPTNPALKDAVAARIDALRAADRAVLKPDEKERTEPIPVDLVTASASGLDPHLSPAAARWQAWRVARLRKVPEKTVLDLIERYTEGRTLGLLGEPRVNVLRVNLALEDLP